jgi:sucrose PTS system EIIBCA or EIIBC component
VQASFNVATVAIGVSGIPLTVLVVPKLILFYLIGLVVSYIAGFVFTYLFGFNDEMAGDFD